MHVCKENVIVTKQALKRKIYFLTYWNH